uniref:GP-PDE domain-containing protein n=1 Tax=Parascaris univalens TaxID=6257 RepID=A0A914ZTM6_PARUN
MLSLMQYGAIIVVIFCVYFASSSFNGSLLLSVFMVIVVSVVMISWRLLKHHQASVTAEKFFSGFRVGGHRGSPRLAPENTIESFEKAREANVDLIEFDLSLTKDKRAILMHDDSLQRTCGEPMLVSSLLLAEIVRKDAAKTFTFQGAKRKACKVPTLEEAVSFCRNSEIKMLFDIKDGSHEMIHQVVNAISRDNLYDDVIVSSFFPWIPYAIKKADPKILTGITWRPYFFSYSDIENEKPRFNGLKHYAAITLDWLNVKLLHTVLPQFLGVEMILTQEGDIDRTFVDNMKQKKLHVVAWTVNDHYEMDYFVNSLKIPFLTDVPHEYRQQVRLQE